jgi:hypothetical protein
VHNLFGGAALISAWIFYQTSGVPQCTFRLDRSYTGVVVHGYQRVPPGTKMSKGTALKATRNRGRHLLVRGNVRGSITGTRCFSRRRPRGPITPGGIAIGNPNFKADTPMSSSFYPERRVMETLQCERKDTYNIALIAWMSSLLSKQRELP